MFSLFAVKPVGSVTLASCSCNRLGQKGDFVEQGVSLCLTPAYEGSAAVAIMAPVPGSEWG